MRDVVREARAANGSATTPARQEGPVPAGRPAPMPKCSTLNSKVNGSSSKTSSSQPSSSRSTASPRRSAPAGVDGVRRDDVHLGRVGAAGAGHAGNPFRRLPDRGCDAGRHVHQRHGVHVLRPLALAEDDRPRRGGRQVANSASADAMTSPTLRSVSPASSGLMWAFIHGPPTSRAMRPASSAVADSRIRIRCVSSTFAMRAASAPAPRPSAYPRALLHGGINEGVA